MIELLQEAGLFHGLLPDELEQIQKRGEVRNIEEGTLLFEAGKPAEYLYVVLEGQIELRFKVVYFNAAIEIPLENKNRSEAFGWSALIEPYTYTLSAFAAKDCRLWQLRGRDIERLCAENSHLGYVIMNNVAKLIGRRFSALEKALVAEIQQSLKAKDPLA